MKKRTKELEYNFKPLVLYLDDLEKIEVCFKESDLETEIETEDFIFDSVEEFKKQFPDFSLKLVAWPDYLSSTRNIMRSIIKKEKIKKRKPISIETINGR